LSFTIPVAEIILTFGPKIAARIAKMYVVDVENEGETPSINVFYENAQVRYKFLVRTHGKPKYPKKVRFPKVSSLGEITKKVVTPSELGEVDGSMELKLFKRKLPVEDDFEIFVDFDIAIDPKKLVTMQFREANKCITANCREIEVLATSNCDFPLEQIRLEVGKSPDFQAQSAKVIILNKTSHNWLSEIESRSVINGADKIKWVTRFGPFESLLFKVITN
jgi:hypothetical protein